MCVLTRPTFLGAAQQQSIHLPKHTRRCPKNTPHPHFSSPFMPSSYDSEGTKALRKGRGPGSLRRMHTHPKTIIKKLKASDKNTRERAHRRRTQRLARTSYISLVQFQPRPLRPEMQPNPNELSWKFPSM